MQVHESSPLSISPLAKTWRCLSLDLSTLTNTEPYSWTLQLNGLLNVTSIFKSMWLLQHSLALCF